MQPGRILWLVAALLLLVAVGVWPPLADLLAQFLTGAVGLVLAGAAEVLAEPALLLAATVVYAGIQLRRLVRRLA